MANKVTRTAPARLSTHIQDDVTSRAVRKLEDRVTLLETQSTPLVNATNTAGVTKGILLAIRVLSGSGTYTPTPGTRAARVIMIGAGGGGAGASSTAGTSAAGGGANSGWLLDLLLQTSPAGTFTGGAYSCGVGGAGGVGLAAAGIGGDTTLVVNGTTYTAKGGTAGVCNGFGSGNGLDGGPNVPATQVLPTGAIRAMYGQGDLSWIFGGTGATGAHGGGTELGPGGIAAGVNTNGFAGTGLGSGGGGAATVGAVSRNGAAGQPGGIIIEEYA